jgi:hypothetical protein
MTEHPFHRAVLLAYINSDMNGTLDLIHPLTSTLSVSGNKGIRRVGGTFRKESR